MIDINPLTNTKDMKIPEPKITQLPKSMVRTPTPAPAKVHAKSAYVATPQIQRKNPADKYVAAPVAIDTAALHEKQRDAFLAELLETLARMVTPLVMEIDPHYVEKARIPFELAPGIIDYVVLVGYKGDKSPKEAIRQARRNHTDIEKFVASTDYDYTTADAIEDWRRSVVAELDAADAARQAEQAERTMELIKMADEKTAQAKDQWLEFEDTQRRIAQTIFDAYMILANEYFRRRACDVKRVKQQNKRRNRKAKRIKQRWADIANTCAKQKSNLNKVRKNNLQKVRAK